MRRSASFGTLAVAAPFGITLSVLCFVRGDVLSGLLYLGLVAVIVSLAIAQDTSARLLICTIAALVCGGLLACFAARSEMTGKGYYYPPQGRGFRSVPVKREESPQKFREGTNMKWGLSIMCAGIAAVTSSFRRDLDSPDFP